MKRAWVLSLALLVLVGSSLALVGQETPAVTGGEDLGAQVLAFIQSAAELLGRGLVKLVNLVLPDGRAVSAELVVPLGYLGLLTVILFLFGVLEAARKVIWLVVGVGWVLMVVRVVLDALG
ncbi:MAG: hypothetical protein ACP5G2_01690 [Candidatus Bipolaricaulaceae bacterium]